MNNLKNRQGSCLCGAVQVSVNLHKTDLGACHCSSCLKWSGGPFMELECGSVVRFLGDEHIQTYESSAWAIRGFCKICGSHLFIQEKSSNDYGISVGQFDNSKNIQFNRQVFYDNKPAYYRFANSTLNISSDYIYQHFPHTKQDKQE